ncbi:hypothetical protein HMPREF1051_0714 [Neisseria sicca VK64]|uniref:Uncharacterized protein n=1 Tax=Neisseria sicca VK64 TaxID=1095748 RepID=I2NQF7_NEISI|nr:hypothetical protein HMPREF1051_0714 [Neisseria sicca VK64]
MSESAKRSSENHKFWVFRRPFYLNLSICGVAFVFIPNSFMGISATNFGFKNGCLRVQKGG